MYDSTTTGFSASVGGIAGVGRGALCQSFSSTPSPTPSAPAPAAAPLPNVTLLCNATTPLNASVHLSRVIAFPPSANVTDAVPLLFLPASAPGNGWGADAILATPGACAALAATPGAPPCASPPRAYALAGGTYLYLGPAAALGMSAAPACTS